MPAALRASKRLATLIYLWERPPDSSGDSGSAYQAPIVLGQSLATMAKAPSDHKAEWHSLCHECDATSSSPHQPWRTLRTLMRGDGHYRPAVHFRSSFWRPATRLRPQLPQQLDDAPEKGDGRGAHRSESSGGSEAAAFSPSVAVPANSSSILRSLSLSRLDRPFPFSRISARRDAGATGANSI